MAGRKSKLTPTTIERVCEALRNGNTRRASCAYAGISQDSFARYLYNADFADAIARAEADAEIEMVSIVRRSALDGRSEDARWWLERHPQSKMNWRRSDELDLRKLTVEQLLELERACSGGDESPGDRLALAESCE